MTAYSQAVDEWAGAGTQGRSGDSGGVQSVDRAITVLEILARTGGSGVTEVALELGVHKSTAFRLLGALEDRGLVEQSRERGKYALGFGVLRLATAVPGRLDLVEQARPRLRDLAGRVGETSNLAVLRSHYAVNLDQAHGSSAVVAHNWVGQLTPLHATSSGKVLLAALGVEQRREVLDASGLPPFTAGTIVEADVLERELAEVTRLGYATTFEEFEEGLNAVAAPVCDHTGAVVAAVSVSGPSFRLDRAVAKVISSHVVRTGGLISSALGYRG